MRGSEVRFYADLADMDELFEAFKVGSFNFTKTLSEVGEPATCFDDAKHLIDYVRTTHPQASNLFLITDKMVKVNTEQIRMKDGSGVKIKADQPYNPDGVLLKLGGELGRVLIATSINTTAETARAKQTFQALKKVVTANARYMEGFYVLRGALRKLFDGWRLTPDPGFSNTEDLKLAHINRDRQ